MMKLTQKLQQFVREHERDDIHVLSLQTSRYPDIDIQTAIRQIQGRQIAKHKLPEWYVNEDILYPKHLSLEQCSSAQTAKYKAQLCDGERLIDITGGMGIDFCYMSRNFAHSIYVERDSELATLASHNFDVLGLKNIKISNEDGTIFLQSAPCCDWLFIDPARRSDTGNKVFLLEDCSPNLIDLEALMKEKSKHTMIKLSPMLDISLALNQLSNISEVHIVSVMNECKELIFIKDNVSAPTRTMLHCVNIERDRTDIFSFCKEDEATATDYASHVGKYLYEPNTSILKAGAYKSIVNRLGLKKLHMHSHLYTSDTHHPDFQGRCFLVDDVFGFSKGDIKTVSLMKQANISVRNFPMSVAELRKRLKLSEGGEKYIFATTLADNKKVLITCHKA